MRKTQLKFGKDNYQSIIETMNVIHSNYQNKRFAFVEGKRMEEILIFFGATNEDLIKLQSSCNELGEDPTLPFRKSRNGRFLIDLEEDLVRRLEFQPFVLSKEEDFVRDDSGDLRCFRGIQDNVQHNTAFQGLIKFQACMLRGMDVTGRLNLKESFAKWVSTIFQLRTITTSDLIGEPAKEGVHSDGVEHTMTTFINSRNMTSNSAISQIHTYEQQTGTPWNKVDDKYVIGEFQHRHFLDTLLIVDSELKHTVSPVNCQDENSEAIRDMIILFTRRPKANTHSTFKYDALNPHLEIPLEYPLNKAS